MADHENVFERAYLDHFARIRGFLCVCIGDRSAVDDLAQDTFLHLWSHPNAFDPARSSLRTYLLGIARKKAADWWRHAQRNSSWVDEPAIQSGGTALTMRDALSKLDADLRNVLWLREAEGYSYEELARILDIPEGTVKSRLFNAESNCNLFGTPEPEEKNDLS